MFVLYDNSITQSLNEILITTYADDSAVLLKNKSVQNMKIDIFVQLTKLYQNVNIKDLNVNPIKSFFYNSNWRNLEIST